MTEIGFHYNAPDKLGYACRLVRKAVKVRGLRVVVVADAPMLDAIDAALWQVSASDFIAHCRSDGEAHLVARSPVILAAGYGDALPHRDLMLNLGTVVPAGFERFERLVDVVSDEAEDRQQGRARWRHYADRGYVIKPHDFAGSAS
ncbi:MAG: DNA polymerase III subunit chi [Variovorax sp.]|nr:MAG: DNA polymerase III subunit chi [Variovorax sp.]